jgi:hypothetical protein
MPSAGMSNLRKHPNRAVRQGSKSSPRAVLKVAVLPLAAESIETRVDVIIHARGGLSGIPREVLNLTVLEGLRQLGLTFDLKSDEDFASE